MCQKTNLLLLVCCLIGSLAWGQKAILQGIVTDSITGEPLISATLSVGNGGAITDFEGNYSMELAPGVYELTTSYVGYESITETIELSAGQKLNKNISLELESTLLNTATVSAGKYEKPLSEVTVSMEVVQPELLENTNKVIFSDFLQKVPGVTVIDGQANIRGGSGFSQGAGSRVLLLVDDLPILQADAGFPNWEDVPNEIVEQVEVIKGAASSLYGSSALNGVINVRTMYPRAEPLTKASIAYSFFDAPADERNKWWDSSNAPYRAVASLAHARKIGKLDLVLGGYYLNFQSFNRSAFWRYGRFNFRTTYRLTDRLSFGIAGNFNQGDKNSFFYWGGYDEGGLYTGAPTTDSRNNRFRYNIDPYLTYYDKSGNRHKFMARYYEVDNNLDSPSSDSLATNRSNASQSYYGEYQFLKKFDRLGNFVMTTGVVGQGTNIEASELYSGGGYSSFNTAAYIQVDKKLFDKLNLSGGVRYEYFSQKNPILFPTDTDTLAAGTQEESAPVFRLGLNYQLGDVTFVRASWGQGYRYPTIAERFILTDVGGFRVEPNPSLQSETGWSSEIGIKQGFKVSNFQGYVDVTAFWYRYADMIEFNIVQSELSGGLPVAFKGTNIGDTDTKGYEISLAGRGTLFGLESTLLAGFTHIDPRFLEFDTEIDDPFNPTQGEVNANNSSSTDNVLKYRSRDIFKFDFETKYKNFSIGLASFYNSHIEAMDLFLVGIVPDLAEFREVNNEGFWLFNGRAAYNINDNYRISVIVENMFNEEYSIRPGLLDAPRNFTAKVDLRF